MNPPPDFWIELIKDNPEVGKVVTKNGKNILKILTGPLKNKYAKIKKSIKDKKIQNSIPWINSSEFETYLSLEELNNNPDDLIVKKYLSPEDKTLYILGRKAQKEKSNLNLKQVQKIKSDAINLRGQRGRIIINFILQNHFDELIIPLLKHQINKLDTDSEICAWFQKTLDSMVQFFPMAFWVSSFTNTLEIRKSLIKRCVSNDFKHVKIHTIGPHNIAKVNQVLNELSADENFPEFDFSEEKDIPEINAITIKIEIR